MGEAYQSTWHPELWISIAKGKDIDSSTWSSTEEWLFHITTLVALLLLLLRSICLWSPYSSPLRKEHWGNLHFRLWTIHAIIFLFLFFLSVHIPRPIISIIKFFFLRMFCFRQVSRKLQSNSFHTGTMFLGNTAYTIMATISTTKWSGYFYGSLK